MNRDLTLLSYRELQKLAQTHGIRSNQKTLELIDQLTTKLKTTENGENATPNFQPNTDSAAAPNKTPEPERHSNVDLHSPKQVHHAPHTAALRKREVDNAMDSSLPQQRVDSLVRVVASLQDRRGSNLAEIVRYLQSNPNSSISSVFRVSNISAEINSALSEALHVGLLEIKSKYAVGGVRYALAPRQRGSSTKRSAQKGSSIKRKISGMVERRKLLRGASASPLRSPGALGPARTVLNRNKHYTPRKIVAMDKARMVETPRIPVDFDHPKTRVAAVQPRQAQTCVKPNKKLQSTHHQISPNKLRQAMMMERLRRRRARNTVVQQCRSDVTLRTVAKRLRGISLGLHDHGDDETIESTSTVVRGLNFDNEDTETRLPTGWTKRESRTHPGRFYYVNESTLETTWEIPKE